MDIQAEKLRFIEEFLKLENGNVISKLFALLKKEKVRQTTHSVSEFAGILTKKEANEMKKIIEDGCENIDTDGW